MMTPVGYYLWKCLDEWWTDEEREEFKAKFFPNGLPKFEARVLEDDYYHIFVDGVKDYKTFASSRYDDGATEKGRLIFQKELDELK